MSRPGYHKLYDRVGWIRKAKYQLAIHPLCKMCLARGEIVAATVADHVVPHKGNLNLFWNGELQSLCKPHHDGAKKAEEMNGYSREVGIDGWPTDPRHPANKV